MDARDIAEGQLRQHIETLIEAAEPMRLREEADCRLGIAHRNPVQKAIIAVRQHLEVKP